MLMNEKNLEILKDIRPSYIRLYLEKSGWKELLIGKRFFDVFQNRKNNELFQINIPTDEELDDYYDLIFDACSKLSAYENISFEDVILRLLNPQADVIKIRTSNGNVKNGTLPFDEALAFFESSKRLVADAAMDVSSKTKYRKSKFPKEIDSFMSKCRFGQTGVGSYVISIICPFDNVNNNNQEQLKLANDQTESEHLARKVVKKIIKSVSQISSCIDKNEDLAYLLDKENDEFVSLNFMEDLSNVVGSRNDGFIEIMAEWDPMSKSPVDEISKIVFSSSKRVSLCNAVAKMKDKKIDEEVYITGYISNANAEPILQQRLDGEITIQQLSTGIAFKTVLQKNDYDSALVAHKNGSLVCIKGRNKNGTIINPEFSVEHNK